MLTRGKRKRLAFTLPDAIWKYVCLFLPTVCIFSQVCKSFKIVIDNTWKQLIKRDFSVGYDIYNIESQFTHVDFKKTYRILKTQCVSSKFDLPNSKNAKINCELLLILIGRSQLEYCGKFLDNLFHIYKESNCPILFTKIQKFIDLFQSYKLKDYLSLYQIGFLLHHVFGKKEEALQYYTMAIPLNIKFSFECVIEMIQCINDPEKLKSMCESYFTVFPTRTYIILFAWAHRLRADNEPHIVLPMALRSLEEYDKRQPDNLVIKSNQDAPRLDILNLIGFLYGEKPEALIYYKQILNDSGPCNRYAKFDVTIKTITILYNQKDTIHEAFDYLRIVLPTCESKEKRICFDWMIKYIDKYISLSMDTQTRTTIQNYVNMCHNLADSPALRNRVDVYQVMIHYFECNYGFGISNFGKAGISCSFVFNDNQACHIQYYLDNVAPRNVNPVEGSRAGSTQISRDRDYLDLNTDHFYTRYIAKCYVKMGKFEDANRIFQLHPKNAILLMDMALMYLEQCDDKRARECFLESKNLPPTTDFDFSSTLQFLETKIK